MTATIVAASAFRTNSPCQAGSEHPVVVLPHFRRRNLFGKAPMLHDLVVFDPVQVDIGARVALVRPLGDEEDEVSLSEQKLDLVYGPVAREDLQVAHEFVDAISDAGLVAGAIITQVSRD